MHAARAYGEGSWTAERAWSAPVSLGYSIIRAGQFQIMSASGDPSTGLDEHARLVAPGQVAVDEVLEWIDGVRLPVDQPESRSLRRERERRAAELLHVT